MKSLREERNVISCSLMVSSEHLRGSGQAFSAIISMYEIVYFKLACRGLGGESVVIVLLCWSMGRAEFPLQGFSAAF